MFRKILLISFLAASLISLLVLFGCSGTQVTEEVPETKPAKPLADTYVPKGMTPEGYLNKYYTLYTQKKFKESYKMLPAQKKQNQSLEEYSQTHESMPTKGFSLGAKKTQKKNVSIDVKLKLKKYGTWTITWQFEKKSKGYAVIDYSASGSSGDSSGSDNSESPPH